MSSALPEPTRPQHPGFAQAFWYWLQLGCISFGGPAGQIALMHQELVVRRRWISEERFLHALNYCMLLPGPEAQQLAIYMGWLLHRTAGGVVAGVLFVLPSLLVLVGLSWVYMAWGSVPAIAGVFYGIKPAVVALVVHAVYRLGARTLRNAWMWALAVAAFGGVWLLQLPFPLMVLAAGLAGALGGRLQPAAFAGPTGHTSVAQQAGPALIDAQTPLPDHARFRWTGFVKVALVCGALWVGAIAVLFVRLGWDATLTQMGWFFTKAALLTFGGAYAVLPYVFQGAVEHFGWLTAAQMMDGLALGETTPGPLIMVVAFVGFVGGWNQALWGPDVLWMAGALAAGVATFFTFLPSFFFILAGAPWIESTHGQLRFTAPLRAITAAVVGVMANLAVFFAQHALWPHGLAAAPDGLAMVMALGAGVALIRFQVGVIPVVLACAVVGLLRAMG